MIALLVSSRRYLSREPSVLWQSSLRSRYFHKSSGENIESGESYRKGYQEYQELSIISGISERALARPLDRALSSLNIVFPALASFAESMLDTRSCTILETVIFIWSFY